MNPRLTRMGICLVAAMCAMNAGAAERSASVVFDLKDFGYQLIDLNPADGIAPALTITQETLSARSYNFRGNADEVVDSRSSYGSTAVSTSYGAASVSFAPTLTHGTAEVSTTSPYYHFTSSGAGLTWLFNLTPFTALVLNATGTFSGSSAGGGSWSAGTYLEGAVYGDNGHFNSYDKDEGNVNDQGGTRYVSALLNTADDYGHGWVTVSVGGHTDLSGEVPTVPEPHTYAMALAGLGVLAARLRRRQARTGASALTQ